MKKILFTTILCIPFLSTAQTDAPQDLEAYFLAIIVSNLDTSIDWYQDVLGFDVVNKVEPEGRGFKQSNLKRGKILIELIELNSALSLKDAIPNYTSKTRVVGFFKTGFLVSDFDKWMAHLTNMKVDFYGNVVRDDTTEKRMAIVTDPDGNRIQIFEK